MPEALQSPMQRRSQYLAEMLKQQSQPQDIKGGWGELAARLLGQALTRTAQNRTDEALGAEKYNADLRRRQQIGSAIGVPIEGDAREVGSGGFDPLSGLVNALRGKPAQPEAMPQAAPQAPMQAAPVPTNTQEPISSPVAPMAQVEGAPLPGGGQPMAMPQAQAPAAPAMAAPQQAQNPLGPTPQEQALVMQYLNSGDPGMIAAAEKMVQEIQLRQASPVQGRYEITNVNGVPYRVDPITGRSEAVFQGGLPTEVMTRVERQQAGNPYGVAGGAGVALSPYGQPTVIGTPPVGFEADDAGALRPIRGGPQDPTAAGNQITNERDLRTEFRRATEEYRQARQGYMKVQQAAQDNTGASDIALIFGFMKTLDPGSTVREGEFATAQNTGSIPERVQAAYNRALEGERLTPQQRMEFARTAETQFSTYQQGYIDIVDQYSGMASEYGLNPDNIIGDNRPAARPQQRQNPPNQPRPQQRQQPQSNGQRRRYNPRTGRIE